ncbi:MAG: thioredoxin family protein [Pseudomonadota bacterium]
MARKTTKRKKSAEPRPQAKAATSRRSLFLYGGAALVLAGGAGTAFGVDFMAKLDEQDLSVIGNGTPAVVQIHDPTCPECTLLQRSARKALKSFDTDALNYRVAYLNTEDGSRFSGNQGLSRVTLALFDGDGQRVHTIQGVREADFVRDSIALHLALDTK